MVGPLPNLHVVNTLPLDIPELLLIKIYIPSWLSLTQTLQSSWAKLPNAYIAAMFSVGYPSGLAATAFPAWWFSFLLPWSFAQESQKSLLCLPAQPLAISNFIYQLKPTRGGDPQLLPSGFFHAENRKRAPESFELEFQIVLSTL